MNNELITTEGRLLPGIAPLLQEYADKIKELTEKQDKLKAAIMAEMEARGIVKIDTPEVLINYIAPTERETLDTKALKAECPDIWDAYAKISPVKATLKVKLK